MLVVKKPSAIVYGWGKIGTFELISDVYFEENLQDKVVVYSLPYIKNVEEDFNKYQPDLILYSGIEIELKSSFLQLKSIKYSEFPPDNILANDIVCQSTFRNCSNIRPTFSVFTPTYKTGDRILRAYESLRKQTYINWEWVVLDDSPDDLVWNILKTLAKNDYRIKLYKLHPLTEGNVGLAKHRVASLCTGEWLVELDHDDALISTCLEECFKAATQYPDAGFIYSDVCELYEDGQMRAYDHDHSGNWYAREDNHFDFGYAGHTWVKADGKEYLTHHYPDINPLSIRFNISMPNHVRVWKREVYNQIGGHNIHFPVADDYELIVRTFLYTPIIHIKKMLYIQHNNRNSTVDNNGIDINRRARLIRDHYDKQIHDRILELDKHDWNWDDELGHSQKLQNNTPIRKYFKEEQVLNYIYE
jgi:glycosyltransferase involved in cell wall biosynthesis